jgi:1-acyl-sn-glycerol-3-phosphate acyltransferase
VTVIRSIVFQILLYILTAVTLVGTAPVYFLLGHKGRMAVVTWLARACVWLTRHVAGIGYEIRGWENVPKEPAIIASMHQAMWETFALIPLFPDPTFVIKDELRRIPVWGQFATGVGMIFVDRTKGRAALKDMAKGVQAEMAKGRHVVIFPEGRRVAPGEESDIKSGITYLYRLTGAPVVPVALNSGFYWGRQTFLKRPGTIIVEFLPAIPPGLSNDAFQAAFGSAIEAASDRLILEADRTRPRPHFPESAEARLKVLKSAGI